MFDFDENLVCPRRYPADLENLFIESPYSTSGPEYLLPFLDQVLIPAVRKSDFLEGERPAILGGQWAGCWPTHSRDLYELRQQLRQKSDALRWLVMFVIRHNLHLSQVAISEQSTLRAVWEGYANDVWAFFQERAFQRWIVSWLHDALRDPLLDAQGGPVSSSCGGGSTDSGDGTDPELRPRPRPSPDF